MIFVYDGSAPLLMIALMIIYYFIYRKEQKENKISQKKIDESRAKIDELQMEL